MVRPRYSIVLLWLMAACGLAIAFTGQYRSQPAKAAENRGPLTDWEFPDAESHRTSHVGKVFAADYAASKPFEEVWSYYAKKMGCKKQYQPNQAYGESSGTTDAGPYQIQILNSSDDPRAARVKRPSVKSATLIRRGAGGHVTIFISRAQDEHKTHFTLIVEGK